MSDWVEIKDGRLVSDHPCADGRYHHSSYLMLANNNGTRRGQAIKVLREALPENHPYRKLTVGDLAKFAEGGDND